MKLAICNDTYRGRSLDETCAHAVSCGYMGLELAPFTLCGDPSVWTEDDAARVGDVVRGHGLEVVGFHWLLLKPEGLHLTTADDAIRARTVAFAQHLVRACAAAGGELLVWGSPAQRTVPDGEDFDDATARAADALRAVCDVAAPLGIRVCLEPLAPTYTNFLTTAQEAIELIERIDHPACQLHLDVNAMASETTPIVDIVRASERYLAHFHANDPNLGGPGSGDVDYAPIVAALRDIGYDGWLSIEVFRYDPDPETIAREGADYLRSVLGH